MSDLAKDLLWGAGAIAKDLFGRDTKPNRRKVYHLHQKGRLPTWNSGDGEDGKETIVTRKSLLRRHFNPPTKIVAAE
jgi:hypothetical protein